MNIKIILGIAASIIVTITAYLLQNIWIIKKLNLSTLIIAIILGALIKNTVGISEKFEGGIKFCSKKVLRIAIVLLGFKLSFSQILKIGPKAVIVILISTTSTILFTNYLGKKFNLKQNLTTLLATGMSICGAAAIAAVNSIIKSDEEDIAYSIGVVTLLGTIFMFVYPVIFKLFKMNQQIYSIWAGSSIHEVAQVVAAGFTVSNDAGTQATIVKLTRVLFIIPVTIILSLTSSKKENSKFSLKNISIPYFVILFLLIVIINSTIQIPKNTLDLLVKTDGYLMTLAMAGLGLDLSIASMKKVGLKPLYLGIISSSFISLISLIVSHIV
ncbi:YeiH family putative sulfate export transporter [Caloramator sp. E03]|uniref:YeiH family protein n=1 Tax=Caloramator sp. E03 TaxID=2576307 RepID=UPI001110DE00|nr:YeiH family protein [Caloramator sp. E03]QCX34353.1 YeiH family putative sulfate export transporter [Caloramator sp. E03]